MVSLGIITAIAIVFMQMMAQTMAVQKSSDLEIEAEEIRRYVLDGTACSETMFPAGTFSADCNSGNPMRVLGYDGSTLIDKPLSAMGHFSVRGRCTGPVGFKQLLVEYVYVGADRTPAPHPVSGKLSTWVPLFKEGIFPCNQKTQPEELTVYDDIEMDPITGLTVAAFLFGIIEGPVMACGDSEWVDPFWYVETSLYYQGLAECPRGYTVIGGGIDCSGNDDGMPTVDPIPAINSGLPFRRKSYRIHNTLVHDQRIMKGLLIPEQTANGWSGACCMRVNTIPINGVNIPIFPSSEAKKDKVFARCKKN